ncbi:MAG: DUF5658 family protein [Halobacteriales archaeon]|nr:DUF5658 family protein [Halobacteriales archaeon]
MQSSIDQGHERGERARSEVSFFLDIETHLWILAFVFFGIGDLVTTHIGLSMEYIIEVGPFIASVIRQHGLPAMLGLKSAAFVVCSGLYLVTPKPHKIGVPLGLAVFGILVTGWNIVILTVIVI